MKIAAQLYTVREFTQTPENFLETLKRVKKIGYESVQLSAIGKMSAEYIKDCIDETGLHVCATHTPYDRLLGDLDAVIEEHKLWNCKYVGLGAYPGFWNAEEKSPKEIAYNFIKEFEPVIKKVNEAGLTFLYHNHAMEFQHIEPGVTFLDYIIEMLPPFGILADFYWTQLGGISPLEFIGKYSGKLKVVHFKDLLPKGNTPAMAAVGDGNINYKAIYEALSIIGTEVLAVEQDDCNGENPFSCLDRSYKNISKFAK